jgi:hypothetical protein
MGGWGREDTSREKGSERERDGEMEKARKK